jgi:hypothetical protein
LGRSHYLLLVLLACYTLSAMSGHVRVDYFGVMVLLQAALARRMALLLGLDEVVPQLVGAYRIP